MKITYTIILGFMLLLLVGCGGNSTQEDPPTPTTTTEIPKSPVLGNKEKTPPSIPKI